MTEEQVLEETWPDWITPIYNKLQDLVMAEEDPWQDPPEEDVHIDFVRALVELFHHLDGSTQAIIMSFFEGPVNRFAEALDIDTSSAREQAMGIAELRRTPA